MSTMIDRLVPLAAARTRVASPNRERISPVRRFQKKSSGSPRRWSWYPNAISVSILWLRWANR